MPELPDLQAFSKNLLKPLKGKKVKKVVVHVAKAVNVPKAKFKKALVGKKLTDIKREGKELHFFLNDGTVLGIHLMLHGNLYILKEDEEQKHRLVDIVFENDKVLAVTDFQKKANIKLNPEEKEAPDALSAQVNYKFLKGLLNKKKTIIKKLLMDQSVIRGIGNAYSDEILWDARISPYSVCNQIPDGKIKALAKSIKKVLKNAEKQILKEHPGIINGEVRDFLKIHNAKKEKSPTGAAIKQDEVGGRVTYYTDEQELYE